MTVAVLNYMKPCVVHDALFSYPGLAENVDQPHQLSFRHFRDLESPQFGLMRPLEELQVLQVIQLHPYHLELLSQKSLKALELAETSNETPKCPSVLRPNQDKGTGPPEL